MRVPDALPVGHHARAHGPRGRAVLAGAHARTDETRAMAERLARGSAARAWSGSTQAIARAATNWRFERIAAVDRNILRLGAYELMKEPGTPSAVIIDEAVELAKRFGEADSPAVRERRARRGPARACGAKRQERRGSVPSDMSDEPRRLPSPGWPAESAAAAGEGAARCGRWASTPYPDPLRAHAPPGRDRAPPTATRRLEELEALGSAASASRAACSPSAATARPRFATLSDGEAQPAGLRARRTTWGSAATGSSTSLDLGDFVGVAGHGDAHAQGRAVGAGDAS